MDLYRAFGGQHFWHAKHPTANGYAGGRPRLRMLCGIQLSTVGIRTATEPDPGERVCKTCELKLARLEPSK